jgi:PAS domain S-box-containing protein
MAYLGVSALGIAAYAAMGPGVGRDLLHVGLSAATGVAALVGIQHNRPSVARAWFALALALGLMSLGNLLTMTARLAVLPTLREFADLLFMLAYVPLFFAAYRFGRGTRNLDGAAILDAGIVGLAAIPVVWQFVIVPNVVDAMSSSMAIAALTIPVVDTVLVSLAAPLILLRASRSPSAVLFIAGLAIMGMGDSAYALAILRPAASGASPADFAWLLSYVLLAGSALVPSASRLGATPALKPASRDRTRMAILGTAILVSPLVMVLAAFRDDDGAGALLALLAVTLGVLVIVRLQRSLGQVVAADQRAVMVRHESELELARLGAAIGNATDAIILTDADGRTTYVNPAFEKMTGMRASEILGSRPTDRPGGQAFARAMRAAQSMLGAWRGDIVSWREDGSDLVGETSISPIPGPDGEPLGYVTISRDVTRERTAARSEDRRARERALIAETLASLRAGQSPEETARAVCEQVIKLPEATIATVLTFDRSGIATVLEQAGRDGGGTSNIALPAGRSAYLRERAAHGPWVEHWQPDDDHPYAGRYAVLGIMAHAYAPILVDGEAIGLLILGSDTVDAIDRMAERLPALVEFAAITATLLGGAVADRIATATLEAQMRAIIDRGDFQPVFQPIVELLTDTVRGYEALIRFDDGTSPDVRFEEAHRLGIGLALERACLDASFLASERLPVGPWLNVNVSPELVLAGAIEAVLPAGDREIVLEITEHQAITDYPAFRAAVESMHDRVQIAVDDAGAGFASLRHIVELGPAIVKLDRSLVAGIDTDPVREAVVAGMVRFAGAAGLVLIAEGIETRDELATLKKLGVELGQGYLLGMPVSVTVDTLPATPPKGAVKRARRVSTVSAAASPDLSPAPAAWT